MNDVDIIKRFYLYKGNGKERIKALGNGVVQLLEEIEKQGSINLACKKLSLSYSKALKIIQNCEQSLGRDVIVHQKGGFERSGSILTEYGKKLVALWSEFLEDCDSILKERVQKLVDDIFID